MTLTLPPALSKKVLPRRAIAGSARAPTKAIQALQKKLKGATEAVTRFGRGVETEREPELAPARREAWALLRDPSASAMRDASLRGLGVLGAMVRHVDPRLSIVASVVEARGLADAVEAEVIRERLALTSENWTWAILVVAGPDERRFRNDAVEPLRHAVCAASETDYAAARERALALREDATPVERANLAFAFPEEPWADDDMRACLADPAIPLAHAGILLGACRDPDVVRTYLARAPRTISHYALDLAVSLPEDDAIAILADAIPSLLERPRYGPLLKTPPRDVATALACFASPAAAARLAPYAGHAILGPIVAGYFQSHPELADVLADHATGKAGRSVAERILAQREAGGDTNDGPVARDEDLPRVLREMPWRPRGKRDSRGPVVEGVALPAALDEQLALPEGARPFEETTTRTVREMTPEEVIAWRTECDARGTMVADYDYVRGATPTSWGHLRVPPDEGLALWNAGRGYLSQGELSFLATHGLAALPGFLRRDRLNHLDYEGADEYLAAIESMISPRIAPLFAHIAARRKKHRRRALGWLRAHAESAALGLIPEAVGAHGPPRLEAEAALLAMARDTRAGAEETIRAAAATLGDEARAAIDALLARDPLAIDAKAAKPPDFLRADDLPAVKLKSGARLGPGARDALLEMLRVSTLDAPYPGVELVRDACDEASLARFASALLEQWLLAGCPGRHEHMLHAIVAFPSEETARRVALLARDWARRDKAKAARACVTLASLGSDLALLHLGHIAETSRFQDLRQEVRGLLEEAADARGLTSDELEDRTVPDLGLDPHGTLTVSFGPRAFVATLDETLSMVVRDTDGHVLRSLPRKAKGDDPALAKAGVERLKALREDAASIADRQVRRLERAMVNGRTFSVSDFRARVSSHPVVMCVARGLVFEASGASGAARTFRVAEDGTFADVDDDTLALDEGDRVRIAHPLPMSAALRAGWADQLSDYQLLQPFEQLGRATFQCEEPERSATASRRLEGVRVEATRLLGLLESRGFARNDTGWVTAYRRALGSGVVAELAFTPGIEIMDLRDAPPQTLGTVTLRRGAEPVTFGALDPITYSELIRDLDALRG